MTKKPRNVPKRERIGLISKAVQLGLIKKWKHPVGGYNVILQDEQDKTDEWEELERFANNRRNMIVNLKLSKEMIDSVGKK